MHTIKLFLFVVPLVIASRVDPDLSSFDSAPSEPKSRFAMLDDVKILANGLLQLGHGLKDFVHKTKGQINDIFQKLNIFDQSFYDLSLRTNEIKEEEKELRITTSKLQVKNEEVKNMSVELNTKLESLLEEKTALQHKVRALEEQLSNLILSAAGAQEPPEVTSLKLRKTGIQEPTENSLSSKSRAPRTTPPLHLNETENTEQDDLPADCSAVYNRGEHTSGVYTIKPSNSQGFNVYCDTQSGSPWTLIQHRKDGSQDFNETWENYEKGFGRLNGEFWLGLEKIYAIVQQSNYILRLELQDWKDSKHYVEYSFHLGSHETNYTLHVAEIAGNIPGALPEHTDLMFSTWNHRAKGQLYCPESYSGGWWWNDTCGENNLNGKYNKPRTKSKPESRRGIYWRPQSRKLYAIKSSKENTKE
uniref:Angiopoietin-related protein 3 n=1 Tax=Mus spicilegus TaxID=10103 RepID=A0A8C6N2F1_MUSSI